MRFFVIISSIFLIFAFVSATDYNILLSEIYSNPSEDGTQFIEFYNPLSYSVDIGDWTIESYSSSQGDFSFQIPSGEMVPGEGFYLIWIKPDEDANWPSYWAEPDAIIEGDFLNQNDDGVRILDDYNYQTDAIGWGSGGSSDYYEECPCDNPTMGNSIERKSGPNHNEDGGNGYDTNNNYEDCRIRNNPEPQNTMSPSEVNGNIQEHSIGLIKAFFESD